MCRFLLAFKEKINHHIPLYILGTLFGIYLAFNILEIYYFPGLVKKYLFFPKEIVLIPFYYFVILFGKQLKEVKILFPILKILLSILAVIFLTFLAIESIYYSNYVLKTYHIHIIEVLNLFTFFGMIFILINNTKIIKLFNKEKTYLIRILTITSVVTIAIYLQINFVSTMNYGLGELMFIIKNSNYDYEQKRAYRWKDIDAYIDLIINNTPPDATILIPPLTQKWQTIGNGAVVKYFIRPRKTVNGDFSEKFAYFDCALFVSGEYYFNTRMFNIWPNQKHKAKRIIFFNKLTKSYEEIFSNYYPDDTRYSNTYGLFCVN